MNIFITGATGYIGGTLAARLVSVGARVRGLVRSPHSAARLAGQGIEPVLGDLDDAELLVREARAADGVINTASADHAPAVRALIAGLAGSGKALLHTSGSSVIGDDARGGYRSEQVFDADTPLLIHPAKQARRDIDLQVLGAATLGVRCHRSLRAGAGARARPTSRWAATTGCGPRAPEPNWAGHRDRPRCWTGSPMRCPLKPTLAPFLT